MCQSGLLVLFIRMNFLLNNNTSIKNPNIQQTHWRIWDTHFKNRGHLSISKSNMIPMTNSQNAGLSHIIQDAWPFYIGVKIGIEFQLGICY